LDEPIQRPPVEKRKMDHHEILKVENVSVQFATHEGVVRAVTGVNLSVNRGEILGIVGESGCGKSTLALTIPRLIACPPGRISGGRILFQGTDLLALGEQDLEAYRGDRISMIFQDPLSSLNPVLTVGYQVSEVFEYHGKTAGSRVEEKAAEIFRKVGIPSPKDRMKNYPHQFSGGMRQRIMIAMAMACEPDLLIADEPTTALDVTIQAQVLTLIRRLCTELGTAVLLITHDLGVVARMCNHVAVMYAGEIVEQADVETIFAAPLHPYTQGLLRCIPRGRGQEKLYFIDGKPPRLVEGVDGCPFAERCPDLQTRCREVFPGERQVSSNHKVRCLKYEA
jgi:oligopeptide transport system ATP-binding protein